MATKRTKKKATPPPDRLLIHLPATCQIGLLKSADGRQLRLLSDLLEEQGVPWEVWRARKINQQFLELGHVGKAGNITAETIRKDEHHGAGPVQLREAGDDPGTL